MKNFFYLLLILELSSCLTTQDSIQIEKQISKNYFIGIINDSSEIGLYELKVINNGYNTSDSLFHYNEYYHSKIKEYYFQDGYVLFKKNKKKKTEYKIFYIRNDSLLKTYTFKNYPSFVSKCKSLNINNTLNW